MKEAIELQIAVSKTATGNWEGRLGNNNLPFCFHPLCSPKETQNHKQKEKHEYHYKSNLNLFLHPFPLTHIWNTF